MLRIFTPWINGRGWRSLCFTDTHFGLQVGNGKAYIERINNMDRRVRENDTLE